MYHSAIVQRLVGETRRLADTVGSTDHKSRLNVLGDMPETGWPTPEHVWYARKQLKQHSAGVPQLEDAIRLLETLDQSEVPPPLECGRQAAESAWMRYGLEHVSRDLNARGRRDALLRLADTNNSVYPCAMINESLSLLQGTWPEAAGEHQRLLREIVLLSGTGLQSASVPYIFGAVYLCPQPSWTRTTYLDLLLHETGHHSLTVKTSLIELVSNPKAVAYSPLRAEPRPLIAVLHATFVLVRITHGLSRVLDNVPLSERDNVASLFVQRMAELRQGINSLSEFAGWTTPGERLFQDMRLAFENLSS
jgi:hypothetical protein